MAVEKPLQTPDDDDIVDIESEDVEVEIVNPESVAIEGEDGGIVIDFDGEGYEGSEDIPHDANLAEYIDEADLQGMASELIQEFENDRASRKEWIRSYIEGLDLLGMKTEERTEPWPGATGVYHPLLTEAVVRFQAQAMGEIFPASGPARTKTVGKRTSEKIAQGFRVENELNYQLTEKMTEYRDEMEQLLFHLPLAGSAFKKTYYDPLRKRPVSCFVPAEDFIVSYGASDLPSCPRYTHVMKKPYNEILKLQVNGFYRDVELPEPMADQTEIEEKYNELEGQQAAWDDDDRHTILEFHVDMNMPEEFDDPDGIARPYIITIDKSSMEVLAIRRNWYEGDEEKAKRLHFVHYKYLPGLGFYGTGLIHLIGGLAKSATSLMRQLIDAGTLSNLPGGLKARGMRIKGDNTPIKPGEFRDVDVPGGTIKDSITFMPYKEPSSVLYQLLGNVVEEGRRIGSVADIDVGDMNNEAPVGTTLALMERSLKVMSGVQARLHASLKQELRLIARIISDYMDPEYEYDVADDGQEFSRAEDFDGRVDIIPVSDPNAATMAQRVTQYQAALQLAQQSPQLYDMGKLHRQMLEVLGIQEADEIVKLPEDIKPKDPVAENMAILKQEPVKAFEYQDHEAHIQVHMAAAQDPKIQQMVGQSPFAQAIQAAMASHVTEHIAYQYRVEVQKQLGMEMPDTAEEESPPLPPDMEREISRLAAQAADKLLRQNKAEAAQEAAKAAEKDPLTIIQRKELELKERELALKEKEAHHDALYDLEKLKLDAQKLEQNTDVALERISSEDRRAGANIGARLATELDKQSRQEKQTGAKLGLDIAKALKESEANNVEEKNGPSGTAGSPDKPDGGQD